MHGLNDLGSREQCEADGSSLYAVVSFNVSTTPVFFRQGMCLPASCDQGMFNQFGESSSEWVTEKMQWLIHKFNIDIYIAPPDVGAEISIVDTTTAMSPKKYYDVAEDGDQPGVYGPKFNYPMVWILGIFLILWILLVVTLSVSHMVHSRKKEEKERLQ